MNLTMTYHIKYKNSQRHGKKLAKKAQMWNVEVQKHDLISARFVLFSALNLVLNVSNINGDFSGCHFDCYYFNFIILLKLFGLFKSKN